LLERAMTKRDDESIDSKQSAQLKQILGSFADDHSTVFDRASTKHKPECPKADQGGDGSTDALEQREL
jgi:hypothetical protein